MADETETNGAPASNNHDNHKSEHDTRHHHHSTPPNCSPKMKTEPSSATKTTPNVKDEEQSDDDIPLSRRLDKPKVERSSPAVSNGGTPSLKLKVKRESTSTQNGSGRQADDDESEDDMPLSMRKQRHNQQTPTSTSAKKKKKHHGSDDDDDYVPGEKKAKKSHHHEVKKETPNSHRHSSSHHKKEKHSSSKRPSTSSTQHTASPKKKKKEVKEEIEVWKWWEEDKLPDGVKWRFLEHSGPMFAPPYEPLPPSVHFKYNGKIMKLSDAAEEVATFYGKMLDHDYTSKDVFNSNFFKDWRKTMSSQEREVITDLTKCDFRDIDLYFKQQTEERKNRTKEEKLQLKEQREVEQKMYGIATIDGHKQKIANFRIEPPGLFRGRGDHPKMGRLKKRIRPEDVIINCSKDAKAPPPPENHRWKSVQHDNSVSWLATWTENVLGQNKYVMLNPSSKIKGEKDHEKYEKARKLKKLIGRIRQDYEADFKSKEMRVRQRAVALYFIDKLALRAGNEKEEGEGADTVGCCSLRVEHIRLYTEPKGDSTEYAVEFDFLGKDSIRYLNRVTIPKRVHKNLELFLENKKNGDDLFDRLNTTILNKHLQDTMEGLTAKVFRTYNASITLQQQLKKLTRENESVPNKMLSYNRANREVAILCNHQRAVPKTFEKSMENLQAKIADKKKEVAEAKDELERARGSVAKEKAQKKLAQKKEQLKKLKIQRTDKDENKDIALGTSKLNYLDPRISVAWCMKFGVPIERVYNKTQREKFQWAIEMTEEDFEF